jgi:hypothetical protein
MIFLNILLIGKNHDREVTAYKKEFEVGASGNDKAYEHDNDEPKVIGKIKIKNLVDRNVGETSIVQVDLNKIITIGRGEDNQVRISDAAISKNHAAIYKKGAKYFVEDLNSTNGTYVDGKRIKKAFRIDQNSKIQIGPMELTLRY